MTDHGGAEGADRAKVEPIGRQGKVKFGAGRLEVEPKDLSQRQQNRPGAGRRNRLQHQ